VTAEAGRNSPQTYSWPAAPRPAVCLKKNSFVISVCRFSGFVMQFARSSESHPFGAAFGSQSGGCHAARIFVVNSFLRLVVTFGTLPCFLLWLRLVLHPYE